MEERLNELEIHCTHLERVVQELNDVVISQQQVINRLERDLRQVTMQLGQIAPSLVVPPEEDEPPPHY
jgi:SlyX protein